MLDRLDLLVQECLENSRFAGCISTEHIRAFAISKRERALAKEAKRAIFDQSPGHLTSPGANEFEPTMSAPESQCAAANDSC